MLDKNLKNLQILLSAMESDHLGKEDFTTAFSKLVDFVKKIEERNIKEMETLDTKYNKIVDSIKSNYGGDMESIKSEIKDLVEQEHNRLRSEHQGKMSEVDTKMQEVKDGKDADEIIIAENASKLAQEALKPLLPTIEQIENDLPKLGDKVASALELLPDGEKLKIDAIEGLKDILDELKNRKNISSMGVAGFSSNSINQHIIDDEIPVDSGDHLIFTLNHTPSPVSSFKLYRSRARQNITEDYTLVGKTLTLTVAFDSSSESLYCDYRF